MDRSFADVYAANARWLLHYVVMLVSDVHAAEDIVADSFARVHGPYMAGKVGSVRGYLRTTASNLAANHLRRRDVVRRFRLRLDADRRGELEHDQQLCDRDELIAALAALTTNQRIAVVLRFYDDASVSDIAAVIGCGEATVRTHLSRGLARLRDQLGTTTERQAV